jgi:hypothetical protein
MGTYDAWKAGELGDDGTHPNSPNYDGDLIDGEVDATCAGSVSEFMAEEMGDDFLTGTVLEVLSDWITSSNDQYANAKFNREMYALRMRVLNAIEKHNDKLREDQRKEADDARWAA